MKLRQAAILDLAILQHWDTKPHIIAASGDDGWFDWEAELPRQVPWRELLIAEDEGRPVGVLQVIDPAEEESHYWGDVAPNLRAIDIWIGEESDLGRGLGSTMMHLTLSRCFSNPRVVGVLIDPLCSKRRIIAKLLRLLIRSIESAALVCSLQSIDRRMSHNKRLPNQSIRWRK